MASFWRVATSLVAWAWLLMGCNIGAAAASVPASGFPYARSEAGTVPAVEVEREALSLRMRDGARLVADVYRPAGGARSPVILVRTIYGRREGAEAWDAETWARRGYAVVIQDVRGKGASAGVFEPWVNEAADGYDTIEAVARQPWANGRVGMLGGSYLGAVQWAAGAARPPSLKALAVFPSISDPFFGGAYDHGVFSLAPFWAFENGDRQARTVPEYSEAAFAVLPLSRLDDAMFKADVPLWSRYLQRELRPRWRAPRWPRDVCAVKAPVLVFMGLWDGDVVGPALNWEARERCGQPADQLIFGPWGHSMNQNGRRGDVRYGDEVVISYDRVLEEWFAAQLKGEPVRAASRARVFVTGENRWRAFSRWGSIADQKVTFNLTPPRAGESGGLSESASAPEGSAVLRQYGAAPSRTLRDAVFADTTVMPAAQNPDDQLVFATPPMARRRTFGGEPELLLSFTPGSADADLFVFVVDIAPDGTLRVVNQPGKLRLSYRRSWDRRTALTPGRTEQVRLRPMDFAHSFEVGHRMGIIIRSEWFPRWARNTGIGPLASADQASDAVHYLEFGRSTPNRFMVRDLD